jgi:hypothetical protein
MDYKKEYKLFDIPNFKKHGVTKDGMVFSYPNKNHNGKWLKPQRFCGYDSVMLTNDNGKQQRLGIHRIIGFAFIPNPENKKQINHKNGNKLDNRIENLEWVTPSENQYHAINTGLWKVSDHHREVARKKGLARRILTTEQVKYIRENYVKGHKMKRSKTNLEYFAKKFNVGISVIFDVVRGKTYSNVT